MPGFLRGGELAPKQGPREAWWLLFEKHPVPMWVFDTATLSLLAVNDAALRHYGYTEKQLLGLRITELWAAGEIIEFLNLLSREPGVFHPTGVWRHRKKNGEPLCARIAICPLRFSGRPAHLAVAVDVTEEIAAQQTLAARAGGGDTLDIIEGERRRIGSELHDGVAQLLLGAELACESLRRKLEARAVPEVALAGEVLADIRNATVQTRRLAGLFLPPELEREDLPAALKGLVERIAGLSGIRAVFEGPRRGAIARSGADLHLYRIAQEAVTNAVRHAKAKRLVLRLRLRGGRFHLLIADDGVGVASPAEAGAGLGLYLMRHRAEAIGGRLGVRRRPGGGTVVLCSAPLGGRPRAGRKSRQGFP